ncbi:MAG: hypothetical protein HYU66_20860 [Armatimonadetes bacterium]|nr:hypothetical protein [Armatimonadota bacterium]
MPEHMPPRRSSCDGGSLPSGRIAVTRRGRQGHRQLFVVGQALKGEARPGGDAAVAAHCDELAVAIDRAMNANVLLRAL